MNRAVPFSYCLLLPVILAVNLQAQIITTVVGNDTAGYSGDGERATIASLNSPVGIAIDDSLNIYFADMENDRIRKVYSRTALITNIAGDSAQGYSTNIYCTAYYFTATCNSLYLPSGIALDGARNIYIADQDNNRIRKVTPSKDSLSTLAGNGIAGFGGDGGPATADSVMLNYPYSLALDKSGNIYIADYYNNRVRKISASTGYITTVAGDTAWGYSGDGGQATSARFNGIIAVTADPYGNLFIVDAGNNCVRKVNASSGIVTTLAGNGSQGYSGDGDSAVKATLSSPQGIVLDANGNVYISDAGNNCVRMVNVTTGIISTIAGNGTPGYSGDGGPANEAELYNPAGLAFDTLGNLYIADEFNSLIRKVTNLPTGIASPAYASESLQVFPIPNNGNLHVILGGKDFTSLSISNELGQLVYRQTLDCIQKDQTLNINLSMVPDGVYYLQAVSQKGPVCKPLIIQK